MTVFPHETLYFDFHRQKGDGFCTITKSAAFSFT